MGNEPTAQTLRLLAALSRQRSGLDEVLHRFGATNPRLFGSVAVATLETIAIWISSSTWLQGLATRCYAWPGLLRS